MKTRFLALLAATGLMIAGFVLPAQASTTSICTLHTWGSCGPYKYSPDPLSNGYDTYVANQDVGAETGTTNSMSVINPGNWNVTANDVPPGYTGVQSFEAVQQLANDWNGNGWGGSGNQDTPMGSLQSLGITYTETSPTDPGSIYEYAPDVWTSNYPDDVMFWADTSPTRCTDNGLNASDILGVASIFNQNWTVYRYGAAGGEIVFILDGTSNTDPVDSGTCAQQTSGTVHILSGFDWLVSQHIISALGNLTQLNTGWEITAADNTQFSVSAYSIYAAPLG